MAREHDRADGGAGKASSRRRLLTRGAGVLAAVLTAEALARPAPAAADNGGNVILGQDNTETAQTVIAKTTDGDAVLLCEATGAGTGLWGYNSGTGVGTAGFSSAGDGVYGNSGGTGNGVYGHANNSTASGVYGQNDGTGFGVAGRAAAGVGVLGDSAGGVGVRASSQNGTALQVTGSAQFTGSVQFSRSGVATVAGTKASPRSSVRVSLPITAKSMMIALLQNRVAGVYVVAAVPAVAGGYFTIYLNKVVTTRVGPIAWIVTETH